MTQCQHCEHKSQLWLCTGCTNELRAMLIELPRSMSYLGDTALHQTRGGAAARRASGYESRLPFEPDTESGRRTRQERAADLFGAITNGLGTIVRDLCESRGRTFKPVVIADPNFIGPLQRNQMRGPDWLKEFGNWSAQWIGRHATAAWWLAHHIHAVAADESAGHLYEEVERYIREIDRLINPPVPMRWIGPCPTFIETERKACGKELRAKADAIEVTCGKCRTVHNLQRLQMTLENDMGHKRLTVKQILEYSRKFLPEEYRIPQQTLHRWIKLEKLKPRGWKRPDGRISITQHSDDDVPVYLWSDVRRLRSEKHEKGKVKS